MKHKNVKPTIKNSPSVCEIHLKAHILENICYHHLVKKRHQDLNFSCKKSQTSKKNHKNVYICYKMSQPSKKCPEFVIFVIKICNLVKNKSPNCKFLL